MELLEKIFPVEQGEIHYWRNSFYPNCKTLVFLPGLMTDHLFFERQIDCFRERCNILVWDAPGLGNSRPFSGEYSIKEEAQWLHEILAREEIRRPVLVGHSIGGYVAQSYAMKYPEELSGMILLDSSPLKRPFFFSTEKITLKKAGALTRRYSWDALKRAMAKVNAETEYGRAMSYYFMKQYESH